MVQLKYFGDSRDFFKYDLITVILEHTSFSQYVFIPMLTQHRNDKEGMKRPKRQGERSNDLFDFITNCNGKSLKHWESWLSCRVTAYKTLEPVDDVLFRDEERNTYWDKYSSLMKESNALIFLDPDTGLQSGKPPYLRSMGREKYILNEELRLLVRELSDSSALIIYQHLPNDKSKHVTSVNKKLRQIIDNTEPVFVCAYREDDVAFLFISKNPNLHRDLGRALTRYYGESKAKYSSLHGVQE